MEPERRRRKHSWIAEVALVLAVFFGLQWWQSRTVASGPAPALAAAGLDGEPLSIESLRGRPTLVHFWATWCGVCRAEEGTIAGLAKDTNMVTVATSSGDAAAVKAYLSSRGISLPVIVDPEGEIATRFGVRSFPTTFVLDGNGEVEGATVGYTTWLGLKARLWLAR